MTRRVWHTTLDSWGRPVETVVTEIGAETTTKGATAMRVWNKIINEHNGPIAGADPKRTMEEFYLEIANVRELEDDVLIELRWRKYGDGRATNRSGQTT